MVVHHRHDGRAHGRPGMRTVVWFSSFLTTALHLLPAGKPTAVHAVQQFHDPLIIGLIESYHN